MTANGHVNDLRPQFPYQMTAQLYRGEADGRLTDVTSAPPARRSSSFTWGEDWPRAISTTTVESTPC